LINVYVNGNNYVGGLIGANENGGTISNSYATGNVNGFGYVGGLVAVNSGTISNSYATGNLSGIVIGGLVGMNYGTITNSYATGNFFYGFADVGGLVGINYGGTISNSYATRNVSGTDRVGGLVGMNYGGTISNSYSTGNVSGIDDMGIVGGLVGGNNGTISNSYATGNLSGIVIGGLVGMNYGTISNSYWDIETSGTNISDGGEGKTTAEMQTKSTFTNAGWDFVNIWTIREGVDYPRLWWEMSNAAPVADAGPDHIIEQNTHAGASVTLDGSDSTDDGQIQPLTYTWTWAGGSATGINPTVTLPLGTTTVTLTVYDGEFSDTDSVDITVVDTTPPTIHSVLANPNVLWPSNHKMVDITVTVDVEDICDTEPDGFILGVTGNEPIINPDDISTEPDWDYTDDPLVVLLRAERAGSGSSRVYTIHVNCVDASGNTATASVDVTVPHDQTKGKGKN